MLDAREKAPPPSPSPQHAVLDLSCRAAFNSLSLSLSFSLLLFLLLSRHPSFPYRPLACASQGADSPTCRERLPCSSTSIAPSCPSPRQPLLPSGSAYFTPAALALLLNSRHDNRSCHHGPPKESPLLHVTMGRACLSAEEPLVGCRVARPRLACPRIACYQAARGQPVGHRP